MPSILLTIATKFTPYISILFFLLGIFLKIRSWLDGEDWNYRGIHSFTAGIRNILSLIAFKNLFDVNFYFWVLTLCFHWSAFAILFGHLRGFGVWTKDIFSFLGPETVNFLVMKLPIYMGFLCLISLTLLLARRVLIRHVKVLTGFWDYAVILLVLAVIASGMGMRLSPVESTTELNITFLHFATLHLDYTPSQPWFLIHLFTAQALVACIPYSRMIHIISGFVASYLAGGFKRSLKW